MIKPTIIVSIAKKDHNEILKEAQVMKQANVPMVEWRADFTEIVNIIKFAQIASGLKKILQNTPLLFTYRTIKEGGKGQFSPENIYPLLHYILTQKKIDMIDIEYSLPQSICSSLIDYAKQLKILSILSSHDFTKTPELKILEKQFYKMSKFNATLIKIATMANSYDDVLNLMAAIKNFTDQYKQKMITIAMSKLGTISRLIGPIINSSYTFANFHKENALGQLSYQQTKAFLDLFE
ncbi:MAG: type I 3-dehydroquinate dehydratase [Streptococcaceae bacterium]|jgi:3-dehydroquinate dehydratase-1|nr:type I 3-dehydroquinate dehydratase [Streptococcaceae bacterium]